jgi:hypothetical protein
LAAPPPPPPQSDEKWTVVIPEGTTTVYVPGVVCVNETVAGVTTRACPVDVLAL